MMSRYTKYAVLTALTLTVLSTVLWQVTGGDYFTKFAFVEQVEKQIDPDDPLAAAGFYNSDTRMETITRDEFRMGLLPTPSGIFDKHAVSVVSVSVPAWIMTMGLLWINRRRRKAIRQAIGHETGDGWQ